MSYTKDPQKLQFIWVDPHLYKYIRSIGRFSDEDEWLVKGRIMVPPQPNRVYHDIYFKKTEGKRRLKVLSRYSKHKQMYGLVRYHKHRFFDEMISHVVARHNEYGQPIVPVWHALEEFLRKYDIYESEYSMENAYKYWQRSDAYAEMKRKREANEQYQQ